MVEIICGSPLSRGNKLRRAAVTRGSINRRNAAVSGLFAPSRQRC
jgi:hypothetical protein